MRLAPIPPASLDPTQQELLGRIHQVTGQSRGFVTARGDGAMIGPYNVLLHYPQWGAAVWGVIEALGRHTVLDQRVHETAILVTGARSACRYELYAHEHVGGSAGLTPAKVAAIAAGSRPHDLAEDEAVGYDVAHALTRGGSLPQSTYDRAVALLGQEGAAELCFLVGTYCLVSSLLNGFDVGVPDEDAADGSGA